MICFGLSKRAIDRFARMGRLTLIAAQSMALYHLLTSQVAEVRTTEGSSMLPTLAAEGDRVLQVRLPLYRATLEWRERFRRLVGGEEEEEKKMKEDIAKRKSKNPLGLRLGDLVVAVSPVNPSRPVCKRIVGLPGDEVRVDPRKEYGPTITVPKGHAFLTGDNLGNSTDSRHYGPVPLGLIKGVVVARVYPSFTWLGNNVEPVPIAPE